MRDDLPSRIRQGLMNFVEQVFHTDILGGQVEAVIQDCLEQSYSHFRALEADGQETVVPRQHEASPPAAGAPTSAASALSGPSAAMDLPVHTMVTPSATVDPRIAMLGANPNHAQSSLWPAAPGSSTAPGFTASGGLAQQQPVVSPYTAQHPTSLLTDPGLTQPGYASNVAEMDTSFLTIEHDVATAHTPVGRSPDGQWDSMDDAAALFDPGFDDLSSGYRLSFSRGNQGQGGFSGRN